MSTNEGSHETRRALLKQGVAGLLVICVGRRVIRAQASDNTGPFRLWASSCSHVTPPRVGKRESLAEAIRQSEGTNGDGAPEFEWDIALHLGDFCVWPSDAIGKEVVRQFSALKKHRREQFYEKVGRMLRL